MDPPENFWTNKSPRKELQGPRPAPLKVSKDSHKIKKPPLAPNPSHPPQKSAPPPRQPVIIYDVSPKIIHTNPNDFMNLVQRLTGPSSDPMVTSDDGGAISPAARFATIEKANLSPGGRNQQQLQAEEGDLGFLEGMEMEMGEGIERTGLFPGILSAGPTSLPPISPNFFSFSPASDPNLFGFFHDLSPVFRGDRNFNEGSFMPSPSSFFVSPSPSSVDFLNNFFDF